MASKKFLKTLFPIVASILAYLIVRKFFPEDLSNQTNEIRGGDLTKLTKFTKFKKLIEMLNKNKALKAWLITLFVTAGASFFEDEIQNLLSADVLSPIADKTKGKDQLTVDGKLKVVCDIIKKNNLDLHIKTVPELLVSQNISYDDKIQLLKIKLDFIINGEYTGKKRFLLVVIISIILTFYISGVAGLAILLEALYQLFREGKISKAVYNEILRLIRERIINDIPIDIDVLEDIN
jgi:hypothetical protein